MDERLRTFLIVLVAALGLALVVVGAIILFATPTHVSITPDDTIENTPEPTVSTMLVQGAGCEVDTDCTYALNAYPQLRCISTNCPEADDPNQPPQGDPAYEWIESYHSTCVNANQMNNQNGNGEELQIDSRAATCTCKAISPAGDVITSVTGQKVCVTQLNEE